MIVLEVFSVEGRGTGVLKRGWGGGGHGFDFSVLPSVVTAGLQNCISVLEEETRMQLSYGKRCLLQVASWGPPGKVSATCVCIRP